MLECEKALWLCFDSVNFLKNDHVQNNNFVMFNLNNTLLVNRQNVIFQRRFKEVLPSYQKKIFFPNPNRPRIEIRNPRNLPRSETTYGPRTNTIGIQMLSKAIYDQVFVDGYTDFSDQKVIEQCKKELIKHNMITKTENFLKDVNFKMPPLKGKNIEEHFQIIGEEQVLPYRELIMSLLNVIPRSPEKWEMSLGWTRYVPGKEPQSVPYPLEEAVVFDVEVYFTNFVVSI